MQKSALISRIAPSRATATGPFMDKRQQKGDAGTGKEKHYLNMWQRSSTSMPNNAYMIAIKTFAPFTASGLFIVNEYVSAK